MKIYVLAIKIRVFDEKLQRFDEDQGWMYIESYGKFEGAVNAMRKWKPEFEDGKTCKVIRTYGDTVINIEMKRIVDFIFDERFMSAELVIIESELK